jgi:two-component system, NarL family, captular synthesis response regulator RcsB
LTTISLTRNRQPSTKICCAAQCSDGFGRVLGAPRLPPRPAFANVPHRQPKHSDSMNLTEKISVFVADHRSAVLTGLHEWFDSQERYRVLGGADNLHPLFQTLSQQPCDLLVMSSELCGDDFAVLRELKRCLPHVPIVVFTAITDGAALRTLQAAGATGVVSVLDEMKDFERVCSRVLSGAPGVMSQRIAGLCEGAPVIAPDIAPASMPEPASEPAPEPARSFDTNQLYRGVRMSVRAAAPHADSRQQ